MKNKYLTGLFVFLIFYSGIHAQEKYNGIDANLSNIYRMSDAKTVPSARRILQEKRGKVQWQQRVRVKMQRGTWERAGN